MDYDACPNLVAMFHQQVERSGDRPFLWAKREKTYRSMSWSEAEDATGRLARALIDLGVSPGDRVVLVSENRPEWTIADLAIMAAGAITVPAYVTNTESDHRHIIGDSDAVGAIVSTRRLAERLLPAADESETTRFVIAMEPLEHAPERKVDIHSWFDLTKSIKDGPATIVEATTRLKRDQTACIIYTSGTGGAPKGVMLHHGAIIHNCRGAYEFLRELGIDDEVFLSFLPLSHSYEHTAGLYFPISIGAQIYFAEGVEHLTRNLSEARPTLMTAVPRLYETMHSRILRQVDSDGGFKANMFHKALKLGHKRRENQGRLGPIDEMRDRMAEKFVRGKVRERFGGRLKAMVSGGAPLNPEIGYFFTDLGLKVIQGYGQTESAPLISVNRPGKIKMDTVGPPIVGCEVRIAEDGEILARGEMVMQGYWRNPEATAEVIRDGWLHTGDVGEIDEDGYIRITDRKKDIIVNSGGDNLSPQRVEGMLTLEPEIAQAMVYGDRRPHLVALLVPDPDWLESWTKDHGEGDDVGDDPAFRKLLSDAIDRVNAKLSNIEKVRHFIVADEGFTMENEQLTPSMKIRRHVIKAAYGDRLEALYR